MIERDYDEGGYYVVCDFCSNEINIQQSEFMRAIEALKMRGWKIIKAGDEWLHKCPVCQKDKNNPVIPLTIEE